MSIPFLANLLVKLHEGVTWTPEEVQTLQVAAGLLQVYEKKTPELEALRSIDEKKHVKKIKTVESMTPVSTKATAPHVEEFHLDTSVPAPVTVPAAPTGVPAPVTAPAPVAAPVPPVPVPATPVTVPAAPTINPNYCIARKVGKDVLPGTEDNKVYRVKQCPRLRVKGEVLCAKCQEFLEEFKSSSRKKNFKWEGALNETPLDHLHVVGSKWFLDKYPNGIPVVSVPTSEPSELQQESLLVDAPAKEVKWGTITLDGIKYIYNLRDRRVYRSDPMKEGEDAILWDSYEGKLRGGKIDPYCEETEEDCTD